MKTTKSREILYYIIFRIYQGDENFLEYSRSYEMVFKCFYNLQNYPFDSQECSIDLKIPAHQMELMQIHPDNFNNNGTFKLEQFWITDIELKALKNYSVVKFNIRMKRIPWFHITTTYMPTMCILVMALATLFIDPSHFEATIMVALTAMLVMYTLALAMCSLIDAVTITNFFSDGH